MFPPPRVRHFVAATGGGGGGAGHTHTSSSPPGPRDAADRPLPTGLQVSPAQSTRRARKISASRPACPGRSVAVENYPGRWAASLNTAHSVSPATFRTPLCQLEGKESVSLFGPRLPGTTRSRSLSQDGHSGSLSRALPLRVPHTLHRSPRTLQSLRAAVGVQSSSDLGCSRSLCAQGHGDLLTHAHEALGLSHVSSFPNPSNWRQ